MHGETLYAKMAFVYTCPASSGAVAPIRLGGYLVKELAQRFVALPLVADLGAGHAAGAGADVRRAVLLTRVVQVAGLRRVQAVVLSGHRRLSWKGRRLTHSRLMNEQFDRTKRQHVVFIKNDTK